MGWGVEGGIARQLQVMGEHFELENFCGMLRKFTLTREQRQVIHMKPEGAIVIKGVAGSGKTTIALCRAKHLIETQANLFREPEVAIFTYNKTLANYAIELLHNIQKTCYDGQHTTLCKNIQIENFHKWAFRFAGIRPGTPVEDKEQIELIDELRRSLAYQNLRVLDKSPEFFQAEFSWIKRRLLTREGYLSTARKGRGRTDRVNQHEKEIIWDLYLQYNNKLHTTGKVDFDDFAIMCLQKINENPSFKPPFSHIIIDEAQDLSFAQILTITKLVSEETKSITIIADVAQQIYKSGFTWSSLGLQVKGRSVEFKNNYRNPRAIAMAALSLLNNEVDQAEFTETKVVSPGENKPIVGYFESIEMQLSYLNKELQNLKSTGCLDDTAILHRTHRGVQVIQEYLRNNGLQTAHLKSEWPVICDINNIKICTMSSIKGLEFNNVFVIDLTDSQIPYPPGLLDDPASNEEHISAERKLLYTCMTRARERLYLIGSKHNPSRFLAEIDPDLLNDITK